MTSPKTRKFTQDEIDYIVAVIPPANTVFPEIAKKIQEGLQNRLRYQLGRVRLVQVPNGPSGYSRAVEDLRDEIFRQYRDSQVRPGEVVGVLAAGATGQVMTQSTLNTFHLAGVASNTTLGIKGFKEIINASNNRSQPSSTIHFTRKDLNLRGILEMGNEIIYLTVRSLVVDYSPENFQIFFTDGLPYWYELYLHLHGKTNNTKNIESNIRQADHFLRLYLDTAIMYSRGISMEELCSEIEGTELEDKKTPPSVICVPSPFSLGIIDIYPINESLSAPTPFEDMESRNLSFLQNSVMNNLDQIALRGIKGIVDLKPTYFPLIIIFENEDFVENQLVSITTGNDGLPKVIVRQKWKLPLKEMVLNPLGLDVEHVKRFVESAGIELIKVDKIEGASRSAWVLMPESEEQAPSLRLTELAKTLSNRSEKIIISSLIDSISKQSYQNQKWLVSINLAKIPQTGSFMNSLFDILDKLKIDSHVFQSNNQTIVLSMVFQPTISPKMMISKAINNDHVESETLREAGTPRPASEIRNASRYYYAYTVGDNLPELLQKEFIDPRYTYSNTVHFNLKEFGIEASRNFLIKEFLDVISADGSSINIQHILLLVDYMTRTGTITKISMTMVDKTTGTLGKMTVANAMGKLLTAGAFGVQDKISGVSSSIIVGKRANIGTAYGDDEAYGEHAEYEKELAKVKERARIGDYNISADQFEESVKEMIGDEFGLDGGSSDQFPDMPVFPVIPAPIEETSLIETPTAPSTGGDVSLKIPSSNILSDHLKKTISSITHAPCERVEQETVYVQPEITSVIKTTSLPTVTGEESTDQSSVSFSLPVPRQTGLSLPRTLSGAIQTANQITFPEFSNVSQSGPVPARTEQEFENSETEAISSLPPLQPLGM